MLGVLTSVAPSKLFTTNRHFPRISKLKKKKPILGCFITYQPQSDSAVGSSVKFSLIIPPRLGGKLAEVGSNNCFKPYLTQSFRANPTPHSRFKPNTRLEGWIAEGRVCLVCYLYCSGSNLDQRFGRLDRGGKLLKYGSFVF